MKKILFVFLGAFLFLGMSFAAKAEDGEFVMVASVDFENVNVMQNENKLEVSFDIKNNHTESLTNFIYVAQISEKENNEIIHEQIYKDDLVTLAPDSVVNKTVKIDLSKYKNGEYNVVLVGVNKDGRQLERYDVSSITINDGELKGGAAIVANSCFLSINGEEGIVYHPMQGVDVDAQKEEMSLDCVIENDYYENEKYFPKAAVFNHSVYGDLVFEDYLDLQTIGRTAKERKEFVLPIKQLKPGLYEAVFSLTDESKNQISSNAVKIHFIVQGNSAMLQDVRADKDYFEKNNSINIKAEVAGSADGFPDSRASQAGKKLENETMIIEAKIIGESGVLCSEELKKDMAMTSGLGNFNAQIKTGSVDCANPKLIVGLKNKIGEEFDRKEITLKIGAKNISANENVSTGISKQKIIIYFAIATIILILIVVIVMMFGKNNGGVIGLFIVFLLASFLALSNEARAADNFNFTQTLIRYWGSYDVSNPVPIGGTVVGTASANFALCNNTRSETIDIDWKKANSDGWHNVANSGNCGGCNDRFSNCPQVTCSASGSNSQSAPSSAGNYTASFKFIWDTTHSSNNWDATRTYTKNYAVYSPPRPTCSMSVSPSSIIQGESSSLNWSSSHTTSVLINQGIGNVAANGTRSVSPNSTTTYTGTFTGAGGTITCSATVAVSINGSCGNAQGNYVASATVWRTPACSSGTIDKPLGTFLAQGETKNWSCIGSGVGHKDDPCSANRDNVNGSCGTKNRTYAANETVANWNANTWCAAGTVAFPNGRPAFPANGITTANWSCIGSGTGHADATTCHAVHALANPSVSLTATPPNINNLNHGSTSIGTEESNLSWTISNVGSACGAAGCTCRLLSVDYPYPATTQQPVSINTAGVHNYTVVCSNSTGGSGSASVNISASCTAQTGSWGSCDTSPSDCGDGNETRAKINGSCVMSYDTRNCSIPCLLRSGWKEVNPN